MVRDRSGLRWILMALVVVLIVLGRSGVADALAGDEGGAGEGPSAGDSVSELGNGNGNHGDGNNGNPGGDDDGTGDDGDDDDDTGDDDTGDEDEGDDSSEDDDSESGDCGDGKVIICHKPGTPAENTLCVAESAWPAQEEHGDD